ncbi:hypothetical protein D3C76_01370 [compost metagenome]
MKNVNVEMSNESLVTVAGLFDIATEGVEKETLVTNINTAIDELQAARASRAKSKWYEVENANPYNEGDVVKITSGDILVGRFAEVVRPSSKANAVKAYLLTPKEGARQGTLITLDFDKIEASKFEAVAPKATKPETTEAPAAVEPTGEDQPSGESTDNEEQQAPVEEEVVNTEAVEEEGNKEPAV